MEFNKAQVGRYDEPLTPVVFSAGQTVGDLFSKAGITISGGEMVVSLKGIRQELSSQAISGEDYLIVDNLKNGRL